MNHPKSCCCYACNDRRDRLRQSINTIWAAGAFFLFGALLTYSLFHP